VANAELNKNVFKWRLKAYKLSQLRMSAGMLFQIKTDECLKAQDAITVRAPFLLNKPQLDERSTDRFIKPDKIE